MTAPGPWGIVPSVLGRLRRRPAGFSTALMDQKQAALRDWLDERDVTVADPEQLRLVLIGAEMLSRDVAAAVEAGVYPSIWAQSLAAHMGGLVAVLAPYVPEEVWPDA